MNYTEWEKRFLNANQEHYDANMMLFELEDKGETSGDRHYSWIKSVKDWKESRDYFIQEYPEFHQRYIKNRATPKQTKLSEKHNGKGQFGNGFNLVACFLGPILSYLVVFLLVVIIGGEALFSDPNFTLSYIFKAAIQTVIAFTLLGISIDSWEKGGFWAFWSILGAPALLIISLPFISIFGSFLNFLISLIGF